MNDITFYALQQCLFSPDHKDKIITYMNNQLKLKAHQRSAEVAEIKDKIDKLSKTQDNLLGMLEDGRASDTIMNRIVSNESELAALTEQLEPKSKKVAVVDDEILHSMTNFPVATSAESAELSATDTKTICIVVLFVAVIKVLPRPIIRYN